MYIDPGAQGLGVGRALLDVLEARAERASSSGVQLDASPSSAGFYEELGYQVLYEDGFSIGEAEFTFVRMAKRLTPPD